MRFTVVTIFPELVGSFLGGSLLGKAQEAGIVAIDVVDPRDFTSDRHRSVDDAPYGGGPGMVMKAEPLVAAIESAAGPGTRRLLMSPAGAPFSQARARELAGEQHILLVCGRYEGIDDRVETAAGLEPISLGDFVLGGGEAAAIAVVEAVARLVPGVLGEAASAEEESFSEGLLEYPQYTRPRAFRGLEVPEALLSGDHERIRRFRREQALARTAARRPDLLRGTRGADNPLRALAARTFVLLAHHPVYDQSRAIVTSSVTNLDVHDIARSAMTYGLAGYYVVTPVSAQRDKVARIVEIWSGEADVAEARGRALARVVPVPSIEAAVADVAAAAGGRAPLCVATSADPGRAGQVPRLPAGALVGRLLAEPDRPALLVLGTGHGLAEEVICQSDCLLEPIDGGSGWNHLSVRSAAAVILDRLFGRRG
jgi:tRNA (guanine37-N1)-methyltransferase